MWGRKGTPGQDTIPWPPDWGKATECLRKGIWGCIGVGEAEGMIDRTEMISGGFQVPGHCTSR